MMSSAEPNQVYLYKKAAIALRPAPEVLEEVRARLKDADPEVRGLAAELAGKFVDAQSVVLVIDLLDDDDREVQEAAYDALRAMGDVAIDPLVALASDSAQPTTHRGRCLGALRSIGLRDERVLTALHQCFVDAEAVNDDQLLTRGLLLAAHLRDSSHLSVALKCLASSDWRVVQAAAKLLTEIPVSDCLDHLLTALLAWSVPSNEPGPHFAVRQLLAAAAKTGDCRASDAILDVLRQALDGESALAPVEAYWMLEKMDLPEVYRPLMEDLVCHLGQSPPPGIIWHATRHLGDAWAPAQLDALADSAQELDEQNRSLGAPVLNALIAGIKSDGDHPLRDRHTQLSSLHLLAKCQRPDFVMQASQLLAYAPWSLDAEVCEMLWVASDPLAEPALLAKLSFFASDDKQARYARSQTLRALGTCGQQAGAAAVVQYLKSQEEIGLHIPEECIHPLIGRTFLDPGELVQLVLDDQASASARAAILVALARADIAKYRSLFLDIAARADHPTLRGYALRMLGFTGDAGVISTLVKELDSTRHLFVAEQAAEALCRLNARDAAVAIDHAVQRFASQELSPRLIEALGELGQPSSLPFLLELLPKYSGGYFGHSVIEALGSFWADPRAREAVVRQLDTWHGGNYDVEDQKPAIRAMAQADPDALVQHAIRLYDAGRLDRSSRSELTRHIRRIVEYCSRRSDVLGLLRRLATDSYLPVREELGQRLGLLDTSVCQALYEQMSGATASWERACAVLMLGYWDGDPAIIESARFAPEFVMRHAGDMAANTRSKRLALQRLVERFQASDGVDRVAVYLALQEQGDEQSIWMLCKRVPEDGGSYVFLRQLMGHIQNRVRDQRREQARQEEKLFGDAGTVYFD